MLKLSRRGFVATALAALAALLTGARPAKATPAAASEPPRRKRWIGHY